MEKHIISILVDNKFSVLTRITSLFSKRGYNIESLSVGVTENPEFSRITVSAVGDLYILEQIIKQLEKLEVVKKVAHMNRDNAVIREFSLIKVKSDNESRTSIFELANIFRGKIVDVGNEEITIELTGDENKIDAFLQLAGTHGVLEISRTGLTALQRGDQTLYGNKTTPHCCVKQ